MSSKKHLRRLLTIAASDVLLLRQMREDAIKAALHLEDEVHRLQHRLEQYQPDRDADADADEDEDDAVYTAVSANEPVETKPAYTPPFDPKDVREHYTHLGRGLIAMGLEIETRMARPETLSQSEIEQINRAYDRDVVHLFRRAYRSVSG